MHIKDKWLKLPAVILFIYIVIRVLDYGKIILYHPLSNLKHDFYSYGPILYFLTFSLSSTRIPPVDAGWTNATRY